MHESESESENEVAQSCPTPSDPMDCSLPVSSIHGIFQVRVLEWIAIAFSVKVAEIGQIRERERRMEFCGKKKLEIFDGILPLEHDMQSSAAGHNRAEMCPLALKQN